MLGSERRSLLDGEISRREATAKDALDQFLGKLVDAFDFQIQEQQLMSAQQQQIEGKHRSQQPELQASSGDAYVAMEPAAQDEVLSPRAHLPAPAPTKRALLLKRLSDKLSEFVLNESIDQAAKENPMELGWARSSLTSGTVPAQRSSWLDDLIDRVTDPSLDQGDDDDDLYFQTDDESSYHGSYEMMPKSSSTAVLF